MRYEHEAPEYSELSVRWYRHSEDTTLGYRDWRLMSHFQPIFSIAHGRLVGLEALLFAAIEAMGDKMIRTIGQARTGFALTLMATCYNIRRTVWLVKSNALPW